MLMITVKHINANSILKRNVISISSVLIEKKILKLKSYPQILLYAIKMKLRSCLENGKKPSDIYFYFSDSVILFFKISMGLG